MTNTLVPQRFTAFFTFIFLFLFVLSSSPVTVSGETCNPEDLKALLAIKASFNNATFFDSWNPNTNCCTTWDGVNCDPFGSGRVIGLGISYDQTITGTIPDSIAGLPLLKSISFGLLPGLVGPLPDALCRLHHLEYIQVTSTSLSGEIPECIGNLKNLSVFIMENNNFSGKIPENVGNSPKLFSLALKNNKPGLTGCIPKSLFQNAERKINVALDLSGNRLGGVIPKTLGEIDWVDINLSDNNLVGDAKFLFGETKFARIIDLSGNKLHFDLSNVTFPQFMYFLDLSHNMIRGKIPDQITQVADLQTLDLSNNRLCGEIPTGGPMSRFTQASYAKNKCLCGEPLAPCNQ